MQSYLIVLGRQPELSVAELVAISPRVEATLRTVQEHTAIIEVEQAHDFFRQLGGAIKIAKVVGRIPKPVLDDTMLSAMLSNIPKSGKVVFGCSVYNDPSSAQKISDAITKRMKAVLTEKGRSARFVRGERGMISSVLVSTQRLIEKGVEVILAKHDSDWVVATTVAVQDFEEFSHHDWGRPGRDSHSGMLPPKLARMMINLSGGNPSDILLDPFCGSGTVVTEALRMGYGTVHGSDSSDIAVADAKHNIEWLEEQQDIIGEAEIEQLDARDLARNFSKASVDCIVTEPYLGPPLKEGEKGYHNVGVLQRLYADAFTAFHQLLRPQGRVVFIFPVLLNANPPIFVGDIESITKRGFQVVPSLPVTILRTFEARLTYRKTILYKRPDQRIGREIVVFQKI